MQYLENLITINMEIFFPKTYPILLVISSNFLNTSIFFSPVILTVEKKSAAIYLETFFSDMGCCLLLVQQQLLGDEQCSVCLQVQDNELPKISKKNVRIVIHSCKIHHNYGTLCLKLNPITFVHINTYTRISSNHH